MARKAQNKGSFVAPGRSSRFDASTNWHGFINVYLTEEVKQKAGAWYADAANVDRALESVLQQGYRVSFKYESQNGAFSVFMTPTDPAHENSGWGLSERASTWWKALCRLLYIHCVCLENDWSANKGDNYIDSDW